MIKTIKKVILSALSILGVSMLFWTIFFLNPNLSYANETQFENITVFHNQDLDEEVGVVINNALNMIKRSELYDADFAIHLCLNDDPIYPRLYPLAGQPLAYAFLNKAIIKNCKVDFNQNMVEAQWKVNNNELRKFNLTWLLAHEFTHNLQYNTNSFYYLSSTRGKINWKLEGHAEYISRGFKNDGKLKNKIDRYVLEEQKEPIGIPVFDLEDGTKQSLSYYKYGLVVQYLTEEKGLSFSQICELNTGLDDLYSEMVGWNGN